MAILKHIVSKNADYGAAMKYLLFEHNEKTMKPVLDEKGRTVLRKEFLVDGINCEPYSFDKECEIVNAKYHKNQTYDEIKSHHYIMSFDPKDKEYCGLTGEKAQALALEYAKKNFPGHQAFVCTHLDGHEGSGNIHTHIVINSVRKLDVPKQDFMERECDSRENLLDAYDEITAKYNDARKTLRATESRIKAVNEEIHYIGQYHANKGVFSQMLKSKNKKKFRQEHIAELELYDSAVKYLKDKFPDRKIPSIKSLKEEKEKLSTQKLAQTDTYNYFKEYQKELRTVTKNIESILDTPVTRQAGKEKSPDIS